MATVLIYAGIKGYKKYKQKKANAAENLAKSKEDQLSISSSMESAHIGPRGGETIDDAQLPAYEENRSIKTPQYTAPYSPDTVGLPAKMATTPAVGLYGDSLVDYESSNIIELPGDSSFEHSSEVFELAGDESIPEPLSPAPLLVVKRGSSPLPPPDEVQPTYPSDESEISLGKLHLPQRESLLEVPESAEELLAFEPQPSPESLRQGV